MYLAAVCMAINIHWVGDGLRHLLSTCVQSAIHGGKFVQEVTPTLGGPCALDRSPKIARGEQCNLSVIVL